MKRFAGLLLTLAAGPAEAHGTLPGGGGFYAGLSHPFIAFEHLLVLIALGLCLGGTARPLRRKPLLAFAVALGAGLALGAQGVAWVWGPAAILGIGVLTGVLLAAALRIPAPLLAGLALGTAAMIGLDTGVPASTSANPVAIAAPYAGVFAGAFLILLNAAALASAATRPPYSIGVRILGSWIAAACLMVLALVVRRMMDAA